MQSGRFIRFVSALVGMAVLVAILYNATMVDRLPPTFALSLSSVDSHGRAMTLTSIDIAFSEEVQQATAESAFTMYQVAPGSPKVVGAFHWQGLSLIFTPAARLPLSTRFHVHVGPGVADIAGNVQSGGQDIDFTTEGQPTVTLTAPADKALAVPVDSTIKITFDRVMDTDKVMSGLTVRPSISFQASWNGPVLTLTPDKPMAYGTTYTIAVGVPAVDTDGTAVVPFASTFQTVGIGLRVTRLMPAANVDGVSVRSPIVVVFDGPIDTTSIEGALALSPSVSGSTTAVWLPDQVAAGEPEMPRTNVNKPNALVFTPDSPLASGTTYNVTLISTVKRADGQVDEGETWQFTTGEPSSSALNQIAFISHRAGVDNVWLMNPDGSNQHQVTSEMVPVSGYDISGDGKTIAYAAGGVVETMSIGGSGGSKLTPSGDYEYSPTFTPDGTGVVVGRRNAQGVDLGYWRYPLVSGTDIRQVALDGAPDPGQVNLNADGLGAPKGANAIVGAASWAPRAAFASDGNTMLIVRGADDVAELVSMADASKSIKLSFQGDSRPIWSQSDDAFYVAGTTDKGATWSCWRVALDGSTSSCGAARSDIASSGNGLVTVVAASDGSFHLSYEAAIFGSAAALTSDPVFSEAGPSFSPNGTAVAFSRLAVQGSIHSEGIWKINIDGTGLTLLSTDGSNAHWVP
jgi:hypothetical protein